MSLFHSKIDPFSSYAINLGPLYVERAFDYLLTKQGIDVSRMGAAERLAKYLELLQHRTCRASRQEYAFTLFYKGHFYQQLANCADGHEDLRHYWERALCYYQDYLEVTEAPDESRYYARWQAGLLEDSLQYPWLLAEHSLLMALAADPLRGEPLTTIIQHYITGQDWTRAYSYSTVAVQKYFNKDPVGVRRWFVDHDAYNWHVMSTHLTICRCLGYPLEAGKFIFSHRIETFIP